LKHAIEEFSSGIVLISVFIGLDNRDIRDRAVNAAEVSSVRPVNCVVITNTTNVTKGDSVVVAFAMRN